MEEFKIKMEEYIKECRKWDETEIGRTMIPNFYGFYLYLKDGSVTGHIINY